MGPPQVGGPQANLTENNGSQPLAWGQMFRLRTTFQKKSLFGTKCQRTTVWEKKEKKKRQKGNMVHAKREKRGSIAPNLGKCPVQKRGGAVKKGKPNKWGQG